MAPKFQTKAGWLTPYALACGYRETAGPEDDAIILEALLHCDRPVYRLSWWEGNYRRDQAYRQLAVARKAFKMMRSMKARVPSLQAIQA